MNFSIIIYLLGMIFNLSAVLMLLPCGVALIYHESNGIYFLITMAFCLLVGIPLTYRKPKKKAFYAREGYVTVALSWIILSCVGAAPFVLSKSIPHPIDAIFETVSGFTTTGASILSDIEALSHCMLFWRSFTHWIGGMGVLVFMLAILPLTGGYHMNLMKAESPGPSVSKLRPKVQSTAKVLYAIYFGMTLVQILLLCIARMPLFDSVCIAMGTAGTGGFATLNAGVGAYTVVQQIIITIFMILFGVNFSVYYLVLMKKFKQAVKVEELRYYLGIIFAAIVLITWNSLHLFDNLFQAVQQVAFQVGSIITTTGFSTTDFDQWPVFSKTILLFLMFVGACAGSTGGGIKVSRFVIMWKTLTKELHLYLHPSAVRKIKMDGKVVSHEVVRSTNIFMFVYVVLFAVSLLVISLDNYDFTTNFSAVAATLNNIGPGLSAVGPTCNFGFYSYLSKIVFCVLMLAGRLEIFPMLLLFNRRTWKKF
ncbi:MAG: TrkH family potassium uptake protein [Eubacteriales bacterium]|nr:TrkH family potassium uptake protein [Eubacteriales bacterium]